MEQQGDAFWVGFFQAVQGLVPEGMYILECYLQGERIAATETIVKDLLLGVGFQHLRLGRHFLLLQIGQMKQISSEH